MILISNILILLTVLFIYKKREKQKSDEMVERFHHLAHNSQSYLWEVNIEGILTYVSPNIKSILGYTKEELVNKWYFYDLLDQKDQEAMKDIVFDRMKQGLPLKDYENRQRMKNQKIKWFLTSARPIYKDGKMVGYRGSDVEITKQKQSEESQIDSQERYRSIITVSNTGAWEYRSASDDLWCSKQYFTMLGYDKTDYDWTTRQNFLSTWINLMHPSDRRESSNKFKNYIQSPKNTMYENVFRLLRKDGTYAWIWSRGKTLKDSEGDYTDLTVGTHIDITEMKQLEERLYLEKEHFHKTLLSVSDGVITTDERGKIVVINQTAKNLTGYEPETENKLFIEDVLHLTDEDTAEKTLFNMKDLEKSTGLKRSCLKHPNGESITIEYTVNQIRSQNNEMLGIVFVFRDISERIKKEEEVTFLSLRDQLTGLYNRRYFIEMMKELDRSDQMPISIMMIDANGLKLMNDVFGHKAGDELLQKIASYLTQHSREHDIAFRVGGDEFVLLLPKTPLIQADMLMKKIDKSVKQDKTHFLPLTLSIGLATKKNEEDDIYRIYRQAEDRMYIKKMSERTELRHDMIDKIIDQLHDHIPNERDHANEVRRLSTDLAKRIGMSEDQQKEIAQIAWFHDIGKIVLSKDLLLKSSPLNREEEHQLKRHPEAGYSILSAVNHYASFADPILSHHEKWDGSGYPKGLNQDQIPLYARIIAITESYDQMRRDQPYRKALSSKEAKQVLIEQKGKQFDPELVDEFIQHVLTK
ncbi:sensor domain-containing diguanylate cyclase/phosphohydrolase [Pelagirhabdus alkalitolerans]|nr:PAS domain S-box protein [Pelagirhabdus alkalitolerans]